MRLADVPSARLGQSKDQAARVDETSPTPQPSISSGGTRREDTEAKLSIGTSC